MSQNRNHRFTIPRNVDEAREFIVNATLMEKLSQWEKAIVASALLNEKRKPQLDPETGKWEHGGLSTTAAAKELQEELDLKGWGWRSFEQYDKAMRDHDEDWAYKLRPKQQIELPSMEWKDRLRNGTYKKKADREQEVAEAKLDAASEARIEAATDKFDFISVKELTKAFPDGDGHSTYFVRSKTGSREYSFFHGEGKWIPTEDKPAWDFPHSDALKAKYPEGCEQAKVFTVLEPNSDAVRNWNFYDNQWVREPKYDFKRDAFKPLVDINQRIQWQLDHLKKVKAEEGVIDDLLAKSLVDEMESCKMALDVGIKMMTEMNAGGDSWDEALAELTRSQQ